VSCILFPYGCCTGVATRILQEIEGFLLDFLFLPNLRRHLHTCRYANSIYIITTIYYLRDMVITANCMYVLRGRGVVLVVGLHQFFLSGRSVIVYMS
jgi:hypothetical protein